MILQRTSMRVILASMVLGLVVLAAPAWADVGRPMGAGSGGTFGIKITHGATTVVDRNDVPFPVDILTTPYDGDAEDYVVLSNVNAGTDYILKVVSDYSAPMQAWRNVSWYIDSISPGLIHTPGTVSLFDPNNTSAVQVEIYNIKFANTSTATPQLLDSSGYYVSFMRNEPGHFYKSTSTGFYNQNLMGVWDVQVRGDTYLDSNTGQYTFQGTPGGVVSWQWNIVVAPGKTTQVVDASGMYHLSDDGGTQKGFVHELGLGVSFTGVPEPGMLVLLGLSPLVLRRRRGH